jgi:G3E family GTPase
VAQATEGRIRLSLLGGFLGSGKTTWLRHQLHAGVFANACIIVNEAADTPVDDLLLGRASRLEVLAGGCACCEAKPALLALLRKICSDLRRDGPGASPDRIVLETSGLADPGPIIEAIRNDAVLAQQLIVSEVIVTVDAVHALQQLRGEPLNRSQVEKADCLIVTKIDAVDETEIAGLRATLFVLNPRAAVFGAVKGSEAPLPAFDDAMPEDIGDPSGIVSRPAIFPAKLNVGGSTDWAVFSVWLSALLHARGGDVLRVKGVMRTPAGRLLVQTVQHVVQTPEILPALPEGAKDEDNTIVVIGRGYCAEDLTRSLNYFAAAARE